MPECTTCGSHVTHEYVRVFGDNENSIESCRNCRASSRGQGEEEAEPDQVVYLEDVLEDGAGDDQQSATDATETGGTGEHTISGEPAGPSDGADGERSTESGSDGRFGLGRIRSLFDQ